jgi:hypothetical protein
MSITLTVNTMTNSLKSIRNKLNNLPKEAYQEFVKITPIAKKNGGNAKRNTKLKGKTIEANYNYAKVLDKGRHMTSRGMRGSDQAPDGMSKPTEVFIKKRIDQILRGK